jgi:hypothetical protein
MVRVLQIFCVLICLSAGAVFALCVLNLGHQNPVVERFCEQPSIQQRFEELHSKRENPTEKDSPLIVQAQAFAAYLNGPVVQEKKEIVVAGRRSSRNIAKAPKIHVVPSVKFKLEGTSYYPDQPERSIALIRTPGSNEENPRWVKEGERLGRFVIHEIRRGVVVYQDENQQLHEMSIERKAAPSLVREHISSITAAGTDLGQLSAIDSQPDSNSVTK